MTGNNPSKACRLNLGALGDFLCEYNSRDGYGRLKIFIWKLLLKIFDKQKCIY